LLLYSHLRFFWLRAGAEEVRPHPEDSAPEVVDQLARKPTTRRRWWLILDQLSW
jgi:hypothetical protein